MSEKYKWEFEEKHWEYEEREVEDQWHLIEDGISIGTFESYIIAEKVCRLLNDGLIKKSCSKCKYLDNNRCKKLSTDIEDRSNHMDYERVNQDIRTFSCSLFEEK